MSTETAQREYTATETQAYERYISAVVEHNIVCARSGATTKEKMDAAFAMDARFREFAQVAGLAIGGHSKLSDIEQIKTLKADLGTLTESVRSASAMLHGIIAMDVFSVRPADAVEADHNACCTLLDDAQIILRVALDKADGI